jgi:glycosyltransferase involved in cell wall biosynthesis
MVSGENRVAEDEVRLLGEAGHEVTTWLPSARGGDGSLEMLRTGAGAIWSRSAARQARDLIRRHRPDVIHVHNLFPMLSPAILRAVPAEGVAVVLTLHNYRLLCLPATFLKGGEICERCVGRLPWRGVAYRCYRGSIGASAALCASLGLHRALGTFDRVRLYLAISLFVRDQHLRAGLLAGKIHIKPNFAWKTPRREGAGDGFLYVGRLAPEKGVATLLKFWRPAFGRLTVVGDGPEARSLERMAPPGVAFSGRIDPEDVAKLIAGSRAVLVPSIWHEPAGRVVLEAYASGVPVIANRVGALEELVKDRESGLLVPPRDEQAWSEAIERLLDNREAERLGEGAYRLWQEHYSPEKGLKALEAAYRRAQVMASENHA